MKITLCALFLLSFFTFTYAQDKTEEVTPKERIEIEILKQESSWNKGDLKGYMNLYWNHDSLVFITPNSTTYGWKNIYNNYKKSYPDSLEMGELKYSNIKITRIAGNDFLATGDWFLTLENEELGGYFTLLFRLINNHWRIIVDYTY